MPTYFVELVSTARIVVEAANEKEAREIARDRSKYSCFGDDWEVESIEEEF